MTPNKVISWLEEQKILEQQNTMAEIWKPRNYSTRLGGKAGNLEAAANGS